MWVREGSLAAVEAWRWNLAVQLIRTDQGRSHGSMACSGAITAAAWGLRLQHAAMPACCGTHWAITPAQHLGLHACAHAVHSRAGCALRFASGSPRPGRGLCAVRAGRAAIH